MLISESSFVVIPQQLSEVVVWFSAQVA